MTAIRSASVIVIATALGIGSQLAVPTVSHAGGSLYITSPSGTGSTCSAAAPCGLKTALSAAPSGSTIQLEPGNYRTASTAYTDSLTDGNGRITIEGQPGKPRPVIYTDATYGIDLTAGSTLRDVKVISHAKTSGPVILLFPLTAVVATGNATVSHVVVFAESNSEAACSVDGTLVDSLCVADGKHGVGIYAANKPNVSNDTKTLTLRGSTILGRGPLTAGLTAFTDSPKDTTIVNATNSIVRGTKESVVAGSQASQSTVTVTLSYCDFGAVIKEPQGGVTKVNWNHRVVAKPVFVNEAHGQLGEAPTSPTIDAGTPDPSGDVDLLGDPRTLGSAPDIGAFEYRQAPSTPKVTVGKRTKHSIHVKVKVNAEGLPSAVAVVAKHGHHKIASSPKTATGTAKTKLKFTVHGLKPHKTYDLHAVATNAGGHVAGSQVTAKTK